VKAAEVRDLTDAELGAKEEELREALFKLRLRAAVSPLENPMRLRAVRRDIARIQTVRRERARAAAAAGREA
jgi:large subunit ribosomal protein L29